MIQNRELTMDDYLGMLRRRARVIFIPALVATVLGFFAYLVVNRYFAKYTSTSTILVEGQRVPENMVQPVVSEDLGARMATLQQQMLSQTNLQPVVGASIPGQEWPGCWRDDRYHPAEHEAGTGANRSVAVGCETEAGHNG